PLTRDTLPTTTFVVALNDTEAPPEARVAVILTAPGIWPRTTPVKTWPLLFEVLTVLVRVADPVTVQLTATPRMGLPHLSPIVDTRTWVSFWPAEPLCLSPDVAWIVRSLPGTIFRVASNWCSPRPPKSMVIP